MLEDPNPSANLPMDFIPSNPEFQAISIDPTLGQSDNQPPPDFSSEFDTIQYPMNQLWEDLNVEHMYEFTDYFEEMHEELGLETDELSESDKDGDHHPLHMSGDACSLHNTSQGHLGSGQGGNASPEMPFYPWTSLGDFATHLLFSASQLCLSQAQKKSVLTWAKTLGAENVPSLYALQKTSAHISKLLCNPTEQFTTSSGNTFYLNAVSKAVEMDLTNPLSHLTMQDYPEDG
ncbi:hypothetical protein J3A83DRAFT_4368800 [Scleroderma citrinum]